ncbi:MAG: preprotein translocase subunit YajC, partial [Verrucomicrobiota bacterium]
MIPIGVAYAMGGNAGGGSGGAGGLMGLAPILLMFVIFYFLLIRPQQKQARKQQEFIKNLKVGDRVVTAGGLHGEIKG